MNLNPGCESQVSQVTVALGICESWVGRTQVSESQVFWLYVNSRYL